jgi:hypothetical protein
VELTVEYTPATATTGIVQAKITTNRPLNLTGERIGWRQISSLEYVKDYAKNVSGEVVHFDDGYGMTGAATIGIDWIYNDPNAFVTTWETTVPYEEIAIPVTGGAYSVYIARGDGNIGHYTGTENITHIYEMKGTYKVSIV